MAKKEILELVPEQIEELKGNLSYHEGYLYERDLKGFNSKIQKLNYDPEIYQAISLVYRGVFSEIGLSYTDHKDFPKYQIEFINFNEPYERIYFLNFRDLHYFLNTDSFYKIILLGIEN